jgi:hypothetical protein
MFGQQRHMIIPRRDQPLDLTIDRDASSEEA